MLLFIDGYKGIEISIEDIDFYESHLFNFEIKLGNFLEDFSVHGVIYMKERNNIEEIDYIEDTSGELNDDMLDDLEDLFNENIDYIFNNIEYIK